MIIRLLFRVLKRRLSLDGLNQLRNFSPIGISFLTLIINLEYRFLKKLKQIQQTTRRKFSSSTKKDIIVMTK